MRESAFHLWPFANNGRIARPWRYARQPEVALNRVMRFLLSRPRKSDRAKSSMTFCITSFDGLRLSRYQRPVSVTVARVLKTSAPKANSERLPEAQLLSQTGESPRVARMA